MERLGVHATHARASQKPNLRLKCEQLLCGTTYRTSDFPGDFGPELMPG